MDLKIGGHLLDRATNTRCNATINNDDITWCENDSQYKHCDKDCFLYEECHPKKVMNVDIPIDIDRNSIDLHVDDSIDEHFIPANMVDRERVEQMKVAATAKYKLVYKSPDSPPVARSILYSDVSDAMKMGSYMKDKKFKEGIPLMVLKDGVPFLRWSADGKSWVALRDRK